MMPALVTASLSKTGGPGFVRRWLQTWWLDRGAVIPLEERTSGNSERMLKIHLGAQRKEAHRDEDGGGEDVNVMAGEPGEELLKPLWLAMSRRR